MPLDGRESRPGENRPAHISVGNRDVTSVARPPDRSRRPICWRVVIESPLCAHVSGYQTRETLTEMRGRAPMWSSVSRAWVTTEAVARDLIARGERKGIRVDVETYVPKFTTLQEPAEPVVEQPDPGRGLW